MDDAGEKTSLELFRTDYTSLLRDSCQGFVDAANVIDGALADSGITELSRAAIDRSLVRMALAVNRATRLIIPAPDAMEFFGLPRSVTAGAAVPEPDVRVHDPGRETWDFRPWLSEKLSHLRENLYALMETTELAWREAGHLDSAPPFELESRSPASGGPASNTTPADSIQPQDNPTSDEDPLLERLAERARYELRASRNYAKEILNAIETMGLTVVDWRLSG